LAVLDLITSPYLRAARLSSWPRMIESLGIGRGLFQWKGKKALMITHGLHTIKKHSKLRYFFLITNHLDAPLNFHNLTLRLYILCTMLQLRSNIGLRWIFIGIQRMIRVDLRVKVIDVPDQDCMTRDNVSVNVNAVLYYLINVAEKAVLEVENYGNFHKAECLAVR